MSENSSWHSPTQEHLNMSVAMAILTVFTGVPAYLILSSPTGILRWLAAPFILVSAIAYLIAVVHAYYTFWKFNSTVVVTTTKGYGGVRGMKDFRSNKNKRNF